MGCRRTGHGETETQSAKKRKSEPNAMRGAAGSPEEHAPTSRGRRQRRQAAALHRGRAIERCRMARFRQAPSPRTTDPPGSTDLPGSTNRRPGSPVMRRPGGPFCCAPTKKGEIRRDGLVAPRRVGALQEVLAESAARRQAISPDKIHGAPTGEKINRGARFSCSAGILPAIFPGTRKPKPPAGRPSAPLGTSRRYKIRGSVANRIYCAA